MPQAEGRVEEDLILRFDFEKVCCYMQNRGIQWGFLGEVRIPSVEELIGKARDLLRDSLLMSPCSVSSAGLRAETDFADFKRENPVIRLLFVDGKIDLLEKDCKKEGFDPCARQYHSTVVEKVVLPLKRHLHEGGQS